MYFSSPVSPGFFCSNTKAAQFYKLSEFCSVFCVGEKTDVRVMSVRSNIIVVVLVYTCSVNPGVCIAVGVVVREVKVCIVLQVEIAVGT